MKASEEIGLLLKGVKPSEIAALKEREAAEEAEEQAKAAAEAAKAKEEEQKEEASIKSALETAQALTADLENKLQAKEDELKKLNDEFAKINNKQTINENPPVKQTGVDVFKELFKPQSKKEEK